MNTLIASPPSSASTGIPRTTPLETTSCSSLLISCAHAETGIEMQTWRAALDVVLDHLAAEPEGADLLHRLGRPAWFTVIGTTKDGQREPVAVLPGRRRPEVAIGAWSTQVQAPTAADAVRAASRADRPAA